MRRAHDAISAPSYIKDTDGTYRPRLLETGLYRGEQSFRS